MTRKLFTPQDLTILDVHNCLDCDDIPKSKVDADHQSKIDSTLINELSQKYNIKSDVAKDMLQHYLGEDRPEDVEVNGQVFTTDWPYVEYFEHARMHHENGDWK